MSEPCILIVDDEANVRHSVRRLFLGEPWTIAEATTAQEAFAFLDSHEVAVVLADHHMPQMLGADLLKEVRIRSPQTARILFSGHIDVGLIREAVNRGEVTVFIPKPWDDDELLLAVRQAVERWRILRQERESNERRLSEHEKLQKSHVTLSDRVTRQEKDLQIHDEALQLRQDIFDHLPVAVLGLAHDGTLMMASRIALELFPGLCPAEDDVQALSADLAAWIADAGARQQAIVVHLSSGQWSFQAVRLDERGLIVVGHPLSPTLPGGSL